MFNQVIELIGSPFACWISDVKSIELPQTSVGLVIVLFGGSKTWIVCVVVSEKQLSINAIRFTVILFAVIGELKYSVSFWDKIAPTSSNQIQAKGLVTLLQISPLELEHQGPSLKIVGTWGTGIIEIWIVSGKRIHAPGNWPKT